MKKILIIGIIILAVVAVLILKNKKQQNYSDSKTKTINLTAVQSTNNVVINQPKMLIEQVGGANVPRLLDLGADKCMACKAMEPVLENLRKEYKGKLQVDFIDVWKNPKEAEKYKVKSIPTQIFFDKNGKEIYRHIGFISEEDILMKFKDRSVLN